MDAACERAKIRIRAELGDAKSNVHFLVGGTQTNLTVIAAAIKPYQGVIAPASGHINVHESGAIEATGHKVLSIPSADGKISAEVVRQYVAAHYADETAEHMVQPGMVYISQPTEVGTIYHKDELIALRDVCKEYGMPLYVDGARLGCALAAEDADITLADLARYTSAFSIGGTKMGALFGEALIINDSALNKDFRYLIKQRAVVCLQKADCSAFSLKRCLQTTCTSKLESMRCMKHNGWLRALQERGYKLFADSPTNQIFPILPKVLLEEISKSFGYAFWQTFDMENDVVRFCTSWATPPEQVDALLDMIPKKA